MNVRFQMPNENEVLSRSGIYGRAKFVFYKLKKNLLKSAVANDANCRANIKCLAHNLNLLHLAQLKTHQLTQRH